MKLTTEKMQSMITTRPTPFYVFDEDGFVENYQHLCKAMRRWYPNYVPGYSYKTNYAPYVCQLVKRLGGWAKV